MPAADGSASVACPPNEGSEHRGSIRSRGRGRSLEVGRNITDILRETVSAAHPDVPLLDLTEQYAAIRDEIDAAMRRVLDSQQFVLGTEVDTFERAAATACGAPFAVGCASGSDALLLALMALDIGPGDQVLCPGYSFFATAGSVHRAGAEPVFVDIEPAYYGLDAAALERAIAGCDRARAIVPVHLFGRSCDLSAVETVALQHDLPLVVDAAQAIGALDAAGRSCGAVGAFGCLSFFPSKNLGAYGDAGLVTTHDPERAERIRRLRVHGSGGAPLHPEVGLNSRLDAIQAAVLGVKLRHLPRWEDARIRNADRYDAIFHAAGASDSRTPLAEGGLALRTPARGAAPARHVFNQYVVRVPAERRDPLRRHLAERGIGSAIYYPVPLHRQPCFASLPSSQRLLPEAEGAARETLALPIYPELGNERLDRVADEVCTFLKA